MGHWGLASSAGVITPAEMVEPFLFAAASFKVVSAVAQDGQAAGADARKGGAQPARVGGSFMAFMYRFFRTFCVHVLAASRVCLVRWLGVWKRMWHVDSDIL